MEKKKQIIYKKVVELVPYENNPIIRIPIKGV